jgi:hypothetical protein
MCIAAVVTSNENQVEFQNLLPRDTFLKIEVISRPRGMLPKILEPLHGPGTSWPLHFETMTAVC